MVNTLSSSPASPPARGLAARVIGVLTSPRAAYADVAAHPRWLGALAVVLATSIASSSWLLSTEVGQRALIDQQLETAEALGRPVPDAQYAKLQRFAPYAAYVAAVALLVFVPLVTLVIAGVAFAIFNSAPGGAAAFRQVFAVVAFSGMLMALKAAFSSPLNYARESLSNPTALSAVLPLFEDNTFAGRLLGSIDLFLIWWLVNLSIGFGVLYKRRTAPIATACLLMYGAIALTIAAVKSVLAGA